MSIVIDFSNISNDQEAIRDYCDELEFMGEPPPTPCNHCQFKRLKARAAKQGLIVTTRKSTFWSYWPKSIDVFVHPAGVVILSSALDEKDPQREKYLAATYLELTDNCVC